MDQSPPYPGQVDYISYQIFVIEVFVNADIFTKSFKMSVYTV